MLHTHYAVCNRQVGFSSKTNSLVHIVQSQGLEHDLMNWLIYKTICVPITVVTQAFRKGERSPTVHIYNIDLLIIA